ncbi:MAG: ATP synthase subunit C [Burkholderiales bacterium]
MKTPMRFVLILAAVTAVLAVVGTVQLLVAAPAQAAGPAGGGLGVEATTWGLLAAALATALAALGAGFAVAKVGAAAVGALAEKPELFGRLLIMVGLAEGIAIYGLIVSILILNRLG